MKTKDITNALIKDITNALINTALATGGYVLAQEGGKMLPTTLNTDMVDGGKIAIGIIAVMFAPKKMQTMLAPLAAGIALQGGANLINKYVIKPENFVRMGDYRMRGVDNRNYALAGLDNRNYALAGASGPISNSTPLSTGL